MTNADQESWSRVRGRLRAELGEDVYSSWFARMDLEAIDEGTVRMSVPTRFLKSWIQSHYAERVLACWQAEANTVGRIELIVRSAVLQSTVVKPKAAELDTAAEGARYGNGGGRPLSAGDPSVHEALGGSPLDTRLCFDTFVVGRSNTLAHAAAKQVAAAKRSDAVMFNPLYIHAGVGLGQNPSAAGDHLGGQRRRRAQGALPHRREVHVRLRLGAAHPDRARLQGSAARHRRAGDRRPAIPARQVDPGRVLPHPQRPDRRRPPGGDRLRPPAVRPRKPRRPRALAPRRRAGGGDGVARRGAALRNPQSPRHGGAAHHPGFDVPLPVLAYIAKTVTHNGRDLEGALNRLLAHNKLTGQP